MIHFVHDRLYVAGMDDHTALEGWDGAVLCLHDHTPEVPHALALDVSPDEVIEPAVLRAGTAFLHRQVQAGRRVVVHCPAGEMFSAVLPLAYLIEYQNMTLPDAYISIATYRPIWPPPFPWLEALVVCYDLPFTEDEIYDEYLPVELATQVTRALHPVADGIWLGSMHALINSENTVAQGIQAVLRVDNVPRQQLQWPDDVILLDLPIPDARHVAPETLDRAVAFLSEQVAAGRDVLVHCQEGVSRSVTMVLAYLIARKGLSLRQAYRRVVAARPVARPHHALLWSLVRRYDLPYEREEVAHPYFLSALAQGSRSR